MEVSEDEFARLMKRSAKERDVGESSSDLNRLEELASVPSTPPRFVFQLYSGSRECTSSTQNLLAYVLAITLKAKKRLIAQ